MINIEENVSVKNYNSFKVEANVRKMIRFNDLEDVYSLRGLLKQDNYMVLGGGCNVLFNGDYNGTVILPELSDIKMLNEDSKGVLIRAYAGVDWDEFVTYCVDNNLGGIENLSLIPGTVGAAPIQNIGAYGVEVSDVIRSLQYYNFKEDKIEIIDSVDCGFGYRDSIFKNTLKNQGIILTVDFQLTKDNHKYNTSYGNLEKELDKLEHLNIKTIREAVVRIRQSKLPDHKVVGNAGSFFKNPIVNKELYVHISNKFENVPCYTIDADFVKIPAAWLIEKAGYKGKVMGNAAVHEKQPLVLINYNGLAKGEDLLELANKIIKDVKSDFGIKLTMEVNVV